MLLVTALPLATSAALSGTNEISKVSYGSEYTLLDGSLDDYVKDCYEGSSWSLGNEKYGATYTIWNGEVYVTCTVLSMSNQTQAPNSISGATDYNGGTPVVLYGINITLDSDDLEDDQNAAIILDLLKMGYIVVVADFENREINETDCMWTVQVLRHFLWNNYSSGNQYTAGLAHTGSHVYFLPEGYSVARGIMYYDLAEDSTRRWYFTPTVALTIGSEYKLVVESGKIKALDDVNKVITNGAVYTFTAE